jgi:hypothetical protein
MFNHSFNPNSSKQCIALRDIEIGEEITEDYSLYDDIPWLDDISHENGLPDCAEFLEWAKKLQEEEKK